MNNNMRNDLVVYVGIEINMLWIDYLDTFSGVYLGWALRNTSIYLRFRKLTNRERERVCVCRTVKVLSCLHRKKSIVSINFHLPFIDISAYSPVDTIVELPVHTANAVFEERSKTYNLIGK